MIEMTSGSLISLCYCSESILTPQTEFFWMRFKDIISQVTSISAVERKEYLLFPEGSSGTKKSKEFTAVTWKSLAESHQLNPCWANPFDGQTDIQ